MSDDRLGWAALGRMGNARVRRGRGHVDFAALLLETARDAAIELTPEIVALGDGLER